MSFTETQFPVYYESGSSGGPSFSTNITLVYSGFEERKQKWSEERNKYEALHDNIDEDEFYEILNFFKAMRGRLYGFRYKDLGDYKSCNITETIAGDDQTIGSGDGATTSFQLVKNYTQGFTYQRDITKPVSGTILLQIDGISVTTNYSLDTTTGIISFTDITKTITNAVSSGANTRITAAIHGLETGDTTYLSAFTGDWAGLNGSRYTVTYVDVNTFDVVFDSSLYAAYSSNAGQLDTIPQSGESITAGYEFDVPVRFDSDEMISSWANWKLYGFSLPIIEIKV